VNIRILSCLTDFKGTQVHKSKLYLGIRYLMTKLGKQRIFKQIILIHRSTGSWNIASWKGLIRIIELTPCSSQDYLKLNHMTKSVVQTLLELSQAWCPDHFPWEPLLVTDHPLLQNLNSNSKHPNSKGKPTVVTLNLKSCQEKRNKI